MALLNRLRKTTFALSCLIILSAYSSTSASAPPALTDTQAKIVIIFNFLSKYVSWPGSYALSQTNNVSVCSIGHDDVTQELGVLKNASREGLQVDVLRLQTMKHAKDCHVLYVAESERPNLSYILNTLQNAPVLTVSTTDNFIDNGGMVGLLSEIERRGAFEKTFIRYEVNAANAHDKQLRINPDALELATKVVRP